MARVLVTNEGSHPPEKWAVVTAETIFPLEGIDGANGDRMMLARKTQLAIIEALLPIYTAVQDGEWDELVADPAKKLTEAYNVEVPLSQAVEAVQAVVATTPWAGHFAEPLVVEAIRAEVGSHIATVIKVERDWAVADFADQVADLVAANPDIAANPQAVA